MRMEHVPYNAHQVVYIHDQLKFNIMSVIGDDVLTRYFYSWRPYKEILARLRHIHRVDRSISWLKRQYARLGLRRRGYDPPANALKLIIQHELNESPEQLRGYRSMWRKLRRKYRLLAKRDSVMRTMRSVDPEGVKQRRSRRLKRRTYKNDGPNHVWHMDGYDKLSRFGLCIHGCIDGFSRKMIWFKVSPTNHDPLVIARFYLEAVEKLCGCPRVIRADYGTENSITAKIHIAFRMEQERCFFYGPSTANILQRIESWWAQWRRFRCDWWIGLCNGLVAEGAFDGNKAIHRFTLAFVCVPLLESDMKEFMDDWNDHSIRRNTIGNTIGGIPVDLYEMPERYGYCDQSVRLNAHLWADCMQRNSCAPPDFYPASFGYRANKVLFNQFGMDIGDIKHSNCKNVYLQLCHEMEQYSYCYD